MPKKTIGFFVLLAAIASSLIVNAFQFPLDSATGAKFDVSLRLANSESATPGALRRRDAIFSIASFPLVWLLPQVALSKDESMVPTEYQAVWFDPKLPNGYRVLFGGNQKATLLLRNEPSDDEIELPVKVVEGKEMKLIFDFSPIGGQSNLEGTFTKNREGSRIISFPDKNAWINKKFEGPIGVFKDSTDSNRVIIIRQVKGPECVVQLRDENKITTFPGKAGTSFTFNFPDKGKVSAAFDMQRRSITFEDGTIWTKY
ncbi:unnamed protein product [Cylindrotheca closterium]|uniref:Uncharacterized protein n=1 Tax=Cylindrotheca closterium TaxID=2856 RepID=A0AAD2JN40_9STRA|nr:unnamed protein product [Cylindrotheca closterium]